MEDAGTELRSGGADGLTAAQRRRADEQRERARQLRAARLSKPLPAPAAPLPAPLLSGGGFLLEEPPPPPPRPARAPSPPVPDSERPPCLHCGLLSPHSYLFDNFGLSVCDACRDADEDCELLTRTEAKAQFLLRDCDLDSREPALRCVRRRNPHRGGADMRLYVRAQVRERALLVWGSEEALAEERERRTARSVVVKATKRRKHMRELRAVLRPAGGAGPHLHRWGAETHDADADVYSRRCLDCDHVETYEKM